jgi:hypothetical protein
MKLLIATTAIIALLASAASAGNLLMEAPVEAEVINDAPVGSMGAVGAWLIPLLAVGLVALAASQSDDSCTTTTGKIIEPICPK